MSLAQRGERLRFYAPVKVRSMRIFEPTALHHASRFELGPFLPEWAPDISTRIQIRKRYTPDLFLFSFLFSLFSFLFLSLLPSFYLTGEMQLDRRGPTQP